MTEMLHFLPLLVALIVWRVVDMRIAEMRTMQRQLNQTIAHADDIRDRLVKFGDLMSESRALSEYGAHDEAWALIDEAYVVVGDQ